MRLPLLFTLLIAGSSTVQGYSLTDALRDYQALQLDEAREVENLNIANANLQLKLTSGSAATVRAAGKMVGIYFRGTGKVIYNSTDPIEHPVVTFEVPKLSNLPLQKTDQGLVISSDVREVFYWAPGAAPELKGSPAPSLADSFNQHRKYFDRVQVQPAMHQFLAGTLTARRDRGVRAEILGQKTNLIYVFDPLLANTESLLTAEEFGRDYGKLRRFLSSHVLSEQPIGRKRSDMPRPPFVVTEVAYTLTASSGKDVTVSATETIVPRIPDRFLHFYLGDEFFPEIDRAPRRLQVQTILDSSGASLPFFHDHNELLVGLNESATAGNPMKLRVEIAGDFLIRPGGDNYWQLYDWFPQPPLLAAQLYTVHAIIKVPKPFVPIAPGLTVRREVEGNHNVLETRIDRPVQFPVVLAGKYSIDETTRNGITIRVATYAGKNPRAVKQLTDLAFAVIDFYRYFLGDFPFSEFDIVQVNSFGFGQAPPGMMFITNEAFNSVMGEENRLFSQGINERFAHEIAHQFWGHVVKMPSLEEQWLTEAFAEYSAALFLRKFGQKGTYERLVRIWRTNAEQATSAAPIPLANRIDLPNDPARQFAIRTGLLYSKGPYLLKILHDELGDETFLTFLKSYQKSFHWKLGTTRDVQGLLEFMTKKNYRSFFERYYWGTELPK